MSKLNSLIDEEKSRKVLVFDGHNIIYRNVMPAWKTDQFDDNFTYWKYLVLKHVFERINEERPDRAVFVIDSTNTWRKKVYAEYKAQRAGNREKSPVDFAKFFPVLTEFLDDISTAFTNILFLKVDECEGDDLIAYITKKECSEGNLVTAISTDRDLNQLFKHKLYSQWDPAKKNYMSVSNPEQMLQVKIVTGDKSDNISSVCRGIGEVKTVQILEGTYTDNSDSYLGLHDFLTKKKLNEKYLLNKSIIDFDEIPGYINDRISLTYDNIELVPNNKNMMSFFIKHKQRFFAENFSSLFSAAIKKLN